MVYALPVTQNNVTYLERRYSPYCGESCRPIVDEIFYTDIPTVFERDEILRIHCRKRGVDPAKIDKEGWKKLVEEHTDRFVGAELEQLICDARFTSFYNRESGQPNADELIASAAAIIPIANSERDAVEEIRKACEQCARPVSSRVPKNAAPIKRSRAVTV